VAAAVEELNELQSSNPRDAGLHYQRGILLYSQSAYEQAKDAFSNAVNVQPNFANARYFLGLSLSLLGDTNGAIAQFEAIKEIDTNSVEAIDQILTNLRAGRDALTNVNSQPEEALEEPLDSGEPTN
jgi:lipoprotein NlpI